MDLLKWSRFVSSAKWRTLQNVMAWLNSLIYIKNERRPRTEPCVTAFKKEAKFESWPFMVNKVKFVMLQMYPQLIYITLNSCIFIIDVFTAYFTWQVLIMLIGNELFDYVFMFYEEMIKNYKVRSQVNLTVRGRVIYK